MVLINDVNTQASGENERVGEREKKKDRFLEYL